MIHELNKATCREISAAAEAALQIVAAELGLEVKMGGGKYDPTAGTYAPKIEFSVPGLAARGFERDASLLGLEGVSLGHLVSYSGMNLEITGINLRARRFPIEVKDVRTGKSYKVPVEAVRPTLGQLR